MTMNHSNSSHSPGRSWANLSSSLRIGLGFGFVALAAIGCVLAARDTIKASPTAELVVNVILNLVPILAAAIGAYVAPLRKMTSGMASGMLSLLPSLLVLLVVLGFLAPLFLPFLLMYLLSVAVFVAIGAAFGIWLSNLVAARQKRLLPPVVPPN